MSGNNGAVVCSIPHVFSEEATNSMDSTIQEQYDSIPTPPESLWMNNFDIGEEYIDILIEMGSDEESTHQETPEFEASYISDLKREYRKSTQSKQRKPYEVECSRYCSCALCGQLFTNTAEVPYHMYIHHTEEGYLYEKHRRTNTEFNIYNPTHTTQPNHLGFKPITQTPQLIQPSASLKLLIEAFSTRDKNIVSLDFEGLINKGLPTQLGLTAWTMKLDPSTNDPITHTKLWVIPKHSNYPWFKPGKVPCLRYTPFEEVNREFEAAQSTTLEAISISLTKYIAHLNQDPNFILVLHGGHSDLLCLKSMGVDLSGVKILDTQVLEKELRRSPTTNCAVRARSLEHCLKAYDIPYESESLHNAANDSYYTMMLLNALGERVSGLEMEGEGILL